MTTNPLVARVLDEIAANHSVELRAKQRWKLPTSVFTQIGQETGAYERQSQLFLSSIRFLCLWEDDEKSDNVAINLGVCTDLRQLKLERASNKRLSTFRGLSIIRDNIVDIRASLIRNLDLDGLLYCCLADATKPSPWTALTVLILSRNNLKTIDPKLFEVLPSVERLDLSYNHLQSLTGIEALTKLTHLSVNYNGMQQLPTFSEQAPLKQLLACFNCIGVLFPFEAIASDSLEVVDLSYNLLCEHSELRALSELRKLRWLNLEGNGVTTVKGHRVKVAQRLHHNVRHNQLILDSKKVSWYEAFQFGTICDPIPASNSRRQTNNGTVQRSDNEEDRPDSQSSRVPLLVRKVPARVVDILDPIADRWEAEEQQKKEQEDKRKKDVADAQAVFTQFNEIRNKFGPNDWLSAQGAAEVDMLLDRQRVDAPAPASASIDQRLKKVDMNRFIQQAAKEAEKQRRVLASPPLDDLLKDGRRVEPQEVETPAITAEEESGVPIFEAPSSETAENKSDVAGTTNSEDQFSIYKRYAQEDSDNEQVFSADVMNESEEYESIQLGLSSQMFRELSQNRKIVKNSFYTDAIVKFTVLQPGEPAVVEVVFKKYGFPDPVRVYRVDGEAFAVMDALARPVLATKTRVVLEVTMFQEEGAASPTSPQTDRPLCPKCGSVKVIEVETESQMVQRTQAESRIKTPDEVGLAADEEMALTASSRHSSPANSLKEETFRKDISDLNITSTPKMDLSQDYEASIASSERKPHLAVRKLFTDDAIQEEESDQQIAESTSYTSPHFRTANPRDFDDVTPLGTPVNNSASKEMTPVIDGQPLLPNSETSSSVSVLSDPSQSSIEVLHRDYADKKLSSSSKQPEAEIKTSALSPTPVKKGPARGPLPQAMMESSSSGSLTESNSMIASQVRSIEGDSTPAPPRLASEDEEEVVEASEEALQEFEPTADNERNLASFSSSTAGGIYRSIMKFGSDVQDGISTTTSSSYKTCHSELSSFMSMKTARNTSTAASQEGDEDVTIQAGPVTPIIPKSDSNTSITSGLRKRIFGDSPRKSATPDPIKPTEVIMSHSVLDWNYSDFTQVDHNLVLWCHMSYDDDEDVLLAAKCAIQGRSGTPIFTGVIVLTSRNLQVAKYVKPEAGLPKEFLEMVDTVPITRIGKLIHLLGGQGITLELKNSSLSYSVLFRDRVRTERFAEQVIRALKESLFMDLEQDSLSGEEEKMLRKELESAENGDDVDSNIVHFQLCHYRRNNRSTELKPISIVVTSSHLFLCTDYFQWIFSGPSGGSLRIEEAVPWDRLIEVTYYDDLLDQVLLKFSSSEEDQAESLHLTLETESSLRDLMQEIKAAWTKRFPDMQYEDLLSFTFGGNEVVRLQNLMLSESTMTHSEIEMIGNLHTGWVEIIKRKMSQRSTPDIST